MMRKKKYMVTVYLETNMILSKHSKVEVFGSFPQSSNWTKTVQCHYSPFWECFCATILLRQGDEFKFIINEGNQYLTSERYFKKKDKEGNINNVYIEHLINDEKVNFLKKVKQDQEEEKQKNDNLMFLSMENVDWILEHSSETISSKEKKEKPYVEGDTNDLSLENPP